MAIAAMHSWNHGAEWNWDSAFPKNTASFQFEPYKVHFEEEPLFLRIAKIALKILFFPLYALYWLGDRIASLLVFPATWIVKKEEQDAELRDFADQMDHLQKVKIEVETNQIDVCLAGTNNAHKRRWVLLACPNAASYEQLLSDHTTSVRRLAEKLNANLIAFNYPGVAYSTGRPTLSSVEKAYKGVLHFLENQVKATEIIHYGHSIGGGAQALGLNGWTAKPGTTHLCIKDRTFSTLADAAKDMLGSLAYSLIHLLGWNINSAKLSQDLNHPEILLQSGYPSEGSLSIAAAQEMRSPKEILHDGLFSPPSTLSHALSSTRAANKHYFIAHQGHGGSIDMTLIAGKAHSLLQLHNHLNTRAQPS